MLWCARDGALARRWDESGPFPWREGVRVRSGYFEGVAVALGVVVPLAGVVLPAGVGVAVVVGTHSTLGWSDLKRFCTSLCTSRAAMVTVVSAMAPMQMLVVASVVLAWH